MKRRRKQKNRPRAADKTGSSASQTLPTRRQPRNATDRVLVRHTGDVLPGSALLILVNSTAPAGHFIAAHPEVVWRIHTFEHFYLQSLINSLTSEEYGSDLDADVQLYCMPDLPDERFDTVIMSTDSRGAAELTRDMLQGAADRLKPHGRLIVSTNNPRDHWLHQQLKDNWGRTTVHRYKEGICYIARLPAKPARRRQFDCEFAFRDGERLIRCFSRPGVFSHRRIDGGARALIRSLNLLESSGDAQSTSGVTVRAADIANEKQRTTVTGASFAPQKIAELGCGSGAVAVTAALRYPNAEVLAVDSNARAVQSTERTAELNDVSNLRVMLSSDGQLPAPETYDLILCNPPYYSDYRISEVFLESAAAALRSGGRIHLVTKLTEWHEQRMHEIFRNAVVHRIGEYDVIVSRR